jgi:hypothetical protein
MHSSEFANAIVWLLSAAVVPDSGQRFFFTRGMSSFLSDVFSASDTRAHVILVPSRSRVVPLLSHALVLPYAFHYDIG